MVASLLMSADAVSNVPAVYGCYLKNFKAKALKNMELKAVHKCAKISRDESVAYNLDVLDDDLIGSVNRFGANIVYLDPPYNERQYSKNYFPLNMIAMTPTEQQLEAALKGKTGIPQSCFMSAFCKKGEVESAFTKLFEGLKVEYIFVSYNSESLLSKEKMMEIMGKYGSVTVIERDYKRFKSFEYNEDVAIKEYLFCLAKK
jgi:adenine-specific DNA-methyltransferase